jgi:cation diffusion facilitator CzcD-associated flavoprotein CzcO
VPRYFAAYEEAFGLPVYRPVKVAVVCERGGRFRIETDRGNFSARGVINATGTWETAYVPEYPGAAGSGAGNCTRRTTGRPRSSPAGT